MTFEEREKIFAKETITTKELSILLGVSKCQALKTMREIKLQKDRLGISGFLHIQDYIEYFNLPAERYQPSNPDDEFGNLVMTKLKKMLKEEFCG